MSDLSYTESVVDACPPEARYDMISDVTRTGEWSPICRPADGPRAGAWFTGRNEVPGRVWETRVARHRRPVIEWIAAATVGHCTCLHDQHRGSDLNISASALVSGQISRIGAPYAKPGGLMFRRIVLAAILAAAAVPALGPTASASAASTWRHAVLIYHSPNRTQRQWEQHLMRVNAAGQFTGQWLFDAVILTTQEVDNQDIMYASLNGTNISDLLTQEFADAAALDAAAAALAAQYGAPPRPIQMAMTLPWLSPQDLSLSLLGITLNLSIPALRTEAATSYLEQVLSMAQAASWSELNLNGIYGIYHQREDASSAWGDPAYVQSVNAEAHSLGLSTIWVPYYDAPNAWSGASLGFNVTDVQPEYSFRDAQYEGVVNDSRLYGAGYKAAGLGQATEYELSSQGNSPTEQQVAHQYLAVAQFTGASANPQVFFTGLSSDIFDQVSGQSAVDASEWQAYTDLASYLGGQAIANTDIGVPWSPSTTSSGALQQAWTPATPAAFTSFRVDFNDPNQASPWRGQVTVSVTGPGGTRTAYAMRTGTDSVNPSYNSVSVPLPAAASGNNTVTSATITVTRQSGSPWPNIMRVVAATADPPVIANGNYGATSSATALTAQSGKYADSQPTYQGYYAGKLTDGQVSSSGTWGWAGDMGWNSESGPFSVTINLGKSAAIGSVKLITHADQAAGINWPNDVSASVGSTCAPQNEGIAGQSCAPAGTSGQATLTSHPVTGGSSTTDTAGTISLPMNSVTGQYVTISGVCSGWCLFDEMQVLNTSGSVISAGAPYTVTPQPTNGPGGGVTYGDDDYKLTDGAVIPAYGPQFAAALDGMTANNGGTVQATWLNPHTPSTATVWMTAASNTYGVILPKSVTIQWRNASNVWQTATAVTPSTSCGPSPCARLTLPAGAQVTGVKATLPGGGSSANWYFVSQISTQ